MANGGRGSSSGGRAARKDPYLGFNFQVEIGSLIVGGFSSISGLRIQTAVESRREGGVNTHEHRLPGPTSYTDLILRRGMSDMDNLWSWYQQVIAGKFSRYDGTVHLMDRTGAFLKQWHFRSAYPIAWEGPEFDAASNQVLFQSLTLAHDGIFEA
ncbi:phage tail protein [Sorangium sp. So ce117]|uniref:phage tail protein n=1 Tax=Sorangium sp. So ce117 TaxID=3133277 RepID=UPI003F60A0F0